MRREKIVKGGLVLARVLVKHEAFVRRGPCRLLRIGEVHGWSMAWLRTEGDLFASLTEIGIYRGAVSGYSLTEVRCCSPPPPFPL